MMSRIFFTACAVICLAVAATADQMKLAVTTSFHNSGLADVLIPEIKKDLDLEVQLLVVGTGQAIRLGAAGDVDAILVHSKNSEETFVAEGNATQRTEIMFNDFVLIGPSSDPVGISKAETVVGAVAKIAKNKALFVSRGDDSGTHKKELALWSLANIGASDRDIAWYKEVGAGMGAALNTASGLNAYIISDRASWLKFGNKGDLKLLYAGDTLLFNQYAYLPVNQAKHDHVNSEQAEVLGNWLVSDRAKNLINGYKLLGEQLFQFNGSQ